MLYLMYVNELILSMCCLTSLNQNNPIIKEPAENTHEGPSTSLVVELPDDYDTNSK